MKNNIITLLLLHLFVCGISQDMGYVVSGTYERSIKKEKLTEAKTMKDINPGYPTSWITDYISTEILVTYNDEIIKAVSTNDTLNEEQRSILNAAHIGSDIVMDVKYKKRNVVTGVMESDTMIYSVRVVPEMEAEYPGGYEEMAEYLEKNAIKKMSGSNGKQVQLAIVKFTVNEEGEITDAQISKTSEDDETDKLLLEVINKMPKWRPAENSLGIPVKQEFELSVGNRVGC